MNKITVRICRNGTVIDRLDFESNLTNARALRIEGAKRATTYMGNRPWQECLVSCNGESCGMIGNPNLTKEK